MKWSKLSLTTLIVLMVGLCAQNCEAQQKKKPAAQAFQWVNPLPERFKSDRLEHATFVSSSMKREVGYCIYLPEAYSESQQSAERFPVVYYLHGGRPGSELKSIGLVPLIDEQISSGKVAPMIYVFVNGGPVSHYNMPDREQAMGEDVFIKELIPHVDGKYRTIAKREGRGLEGFSQGGRGTARIMFKHPELFISAAPGGGGYETEKKISENDGYENPHLRFTPGYNTWDLAREYAKSPEPKLNILIHVGTKGFNYENNLAYMEFLDSLKIPYSKVIVPEAPHSAKVIYEKRGMEIMKFHEKKFAVARKGR
ncbi:alpha/beta hydrolase [Rubinisphaera italica]|uniref:Endo-1,4-beta-xylanase/feruloyl esterase n=1 Tax=Rubinisphaera italica TaxID=2527969 RepID=A0A5C5XMU7_9PLAN|nr:alpha/beta hydrolase-fold protein [Rubinisphaera italica]TWT64280.1 Endo-1,4-beta-xylanase/feruloyl esterase precursor [Rubinisphaera italica]